ncbi:MAG: hypothetical protein H6719_29185 [Sandaracinaceae bacterium]|nr:hypothetical protein [Sandaracinaceae bacterium]
MDERGVCDDCVSRLTELERVPPTVGNVIVGAVGLVPKVGLPALLLVTGVALAMYFLRHEAFGIPFLGWGLDVAAQGVMLGLAHRAIHGRPVNLAATAQATTDHLFRLIFVAFIAHIQIVVLYAIPSLLVLFVVSQMSPDALLPALAVAQIAGLVLALWRASTLAVALPVTLHEGHTGFSALGISTRRMKEHRAPAFVFALAGLAWLIVPLVHEALTLGLSMIGWLGDLVDLGPLRPWTEQLVELAPVIEISQSVLTAVALLFMTATSAVLYAKTVGYRVY